MKAIEKLDLIRNAFQLNCIDLSFMGGYGCVLHELGLPIDTNDPVVQQSYEQDLQRIKMMKLVKRLYTIQEIYLTFFV